VQNARIRAHTCLVKKEKEEGVGTCRDVEVEREEKGDARGGGGRGGAGQGVRNVCILLHVTEYAYTLHHEKSEGEKEREGWEDWKKGRRGVSGGR